MLILPAMKVRLDCVQVRVTQRKDADTHKWKVFTIPQDVNCYGLRGDYIIRQVSSAYVRVASAAFKLLLAGVLDLTSSG